MKLRYYLRGLGMGMIAAALVLGLRADAAISMTDAEIMEKARQLGMVESSSLVLSDLKAPEQNLAQPDNVEPGNVEPARPENADPEDADITEPENINPDGTDPEDANVAEPENTEQEGTAPQDTGSDMSDKKDVIYSDDPVQFTIDEGTNSYTVSKNLVEAGLIKDVVSFDSYLIENGYSKSIRSGTYEILPGTSEKDIARIITGN